MFFSLSSSCLEEENLRFVDTSKAAEQEDVEEVVEAVSLNTLTTHPHQSLNLLLRKRLHCRMP